MKKIVLIFMLLCSQACIALDGPSWYQIEDIPPGLASMTATLSAKIVYTDQLQDLSAKSFLDETYFSDLLNMLNHRIVNLATPSAYGDAVNKGLLDYHSNCTSGTHGIASGDSFVSANATQTIYNKTISSSTISYTNITNSTVNGSPIVTSGSEILHYGSNEYVAYALPSIQFNDYGYSVASSIGSITLHIYDDATKTYLISTKLSCYHTLVNPASTLAVTCLTTSAGLPDSWVILYDSTCASKTNQLPISWLVTVGAYRDLTINMMVTATLAGSGELFSVHAYGGKKDGIEYPFYFIELGNMQ